MGFIVFILGFFGLVGIAMVGAKVLGLTPEGGEEVEGNRKSNGY
jgi:hypothetical protein